MLPKVSWKLNLAMLWFSQLVIFAGFQALIPFVSLFIKNELGVTDTVELAAAVTAFNFFGTFAYAIFNPVWGTLADRFGVKPMLLRGTFVTGLIFPLMAYSKTVWFLVLLRFITAACAGTTAASQTMIVRNTPNENQGFALGVLTTAIWGGSMLGFVIGGLLIHYFDYTVAFWVCGLMYIAGGISILFTRDGAVQAVHVKSHIRQSGLERFIPNLTRQVWVMLVLFLLMGFVRSFEAPYIALKVEELSSKESAAFWTGITSAVVCAAAILSGIYTGWLVDRLPPQKILYPVMIISAIALAGQGFAKNLVVFAVSRVILYMAAGGLQPVLQKTLAQITPARKRGSVFGFASSTQGIGTMLAAAASGVAMVHCGISGVFYIGGLFFLLMLPVSVKSIDFALKVPVFRHLRRKSA